VVSQTVPCDYIGILGLSFKTGSDDVRLTPSKDIIQKLIDKGYKNIIAYDPIANDAFKVEYPELKITYKDTLEALLKSVKSVLILTGWKEFKEKKDIITDGKMVFDFRYLYSFSMFCVAL
jgi:UDPglucose 6-dehydrogenase